MRLNGSAKMPIILACMIVVALSCSLFNQLPAPPNSASLVRLGDTLFHLERNRSLVSVAIPFSFSARGKTVYLDYCGAHAAFELQRWVHGRWRKAFAPDCPMFLAPKITIAGGEFSDVARGTLEIDRPDRDTDRQLIPGQYRLVLFAAWHMADRTMAYALIDSLPLAERASNPFAIQ